MLTKLLLVARSRLKSRASLEAENLVLRQQVTVLSRKVTSRCTVSGRAANNCEKIRDTHIMCYETDRNVAREFVAAHNGRLALEYLPGYAPELNPVGYWKHHELPNFCPRDFAELNHHARRALRCMRRRPRLVQSFWRQAELSL